MNDLRKLRHLIMTLALLCGGVVPARTDELVRKNLTYRSDQRHVTGELRWNTAKKSLSVHDEAGRETVWPARLELSDAHIQPPPVSVAERPDEVVAVLGYRERLTGRLRSVDSDDRVAWTISDGAAPIEFQASSAFAWSINPTKIVALFRSFENPDDPDSVVLPGPAPDGSRALRLTGTRRETLDSLGAASFGKRLVQFAFLEAEAAEANGPLRLSVFGPSADRPLIELELRSSGDTWEIASPQNARESIARIPRRPGFHFLGVLIGEDRARVCIDESVVLTLRESGLDASVLSAVAIGATAERPRIVDSLGVYCYGPAPSLLQRPIEDDLIQFGGGHEWLGRFSGLKDGLWRLSKDDQTRTVPLGLTRTWAPHSLQSVGRWVLGPVLSVSFFRAGGSVWESEANDGYFASLGLLDAPGRGQDRIEGVVESMSETALTLRLSQGGSVVLPFDRIVSIEKSDAVGMRVVDSRLHHLGDEVDLRVIPPDPSGNHLELTFDADAEQAGWPTRLAVDVVEVLSVESPRFGDLIRKGELITEVRLNDSLLGTLNEKVSEANESPERIAFDLPPRILKAGTNRIEFRQKGRSNDPNYLDDLGILGVRLYRRP
jgi:hypothetical protein